MDLAGPHWPIGSRENTGHGIKDRAMPKHMVIAP
jgi:hypothetical protein